jgi:predicted transcriptional regulator
VLLHRLQEIGLKGLELARAQFDTIQKKVLKVGARVRELVTKIKFHFPTSFPLKEVFARIVFNLSMAFP